MNKFQEFLLAHRLDENFQFAFDFFSDRDFQFDVCYREWPDVVFMAQLAFNAGLEIRQFYLLALRLAQDVARLNNAPHVEKAIRSAQNYIESQSRENIIELELAAKAAGDAAIEEEYAGNIEAANVSWAAWGAANAVYHRRIYFAVRAIESAEKTELFSPKEFANLVDEVVKDFLYSKFDERGKVTVDEVETEVAYLRNLIAQSEFRVNAKF